MDRNSQCADADATRRRRAWFNRTVVGKALRRRALGLAAADAAPAIAFALGLAMAVADLPRGLAAMAPGLALMAIAALSRAIVGLAAQRAGAELARDVKRTVRRRVVEAAFLARPGDRPQVGEAMTLVVEGVETLDGYFSRYAPARFAAMTAPFAILAAMALASPVAALIALAAFVPFIAAMALAGGAASHEARRQFEALSRLSGLFADRVRALPTILAFQAEEPTAEALARGSDELARRTLRVLRRAFLSTAALEFFAALSVALIAVYCGFNLLRLLPFPVPERLDLARAVFVLALAPELYAPLRRLAAAYHDRQAAEAAADRLMAAPDASPPAADTGLVDGPAPALRFRNVRVTYPGADRPAVDAFDLEVRPGEIVALMGPTGSGKSTVLNLLLGLASATAGEVQVDGLPIDPQRGVASRAAWAGQAPVVVPGAVRDNIALGRPSATIREIAEAAARTGLDAAPGGISRYIDERGGGLSGGERRRLALARALLRASPVLLLDEPTANLDARSEQEMLPVIQGAARGRTTLIATHSPAVAALADRVVRLAA
jgi:ATP-binding cassette subfamily C protein CydD